MTVNETMTALADAVRLKQDGTSAALSLDEMTGAVLGLSYANIPAYHYEEAGRVIQNIRAWKASHANSLVFGCITDNHVLENDATKTEPTRRSIRHAAFALEMVGGLAGCDFVANLGDNCWENGIDTDNALQGAKYTHDATLAAFARVPSYRLLGNHDKTSETAKGYALNGVYNVFDAHGATQMRGFGYKDYAAQKVRVICLNSVDYMNVSGGYGMSYDQKDFLIRALDLSAKSDAAQWGILLLSHIPLDYAGGDYNTGADVAAILSAYENGGSVSITVNSSYAKNETPANYATYSGGKLVYNYAGKNAAQIIANVHGHVHNTSRGKLTDSGIVRISTPNSCFYETYQTKYGYSVDSTEYGKLTKVANSAKDTAAAFYCVDLDEQTVYAFGYGAGVDFVLPYKAATMYSVTYNLTNVTSSNTVGEAVEGSAFSATLAPSDAEATMGSVKVTMGGVDITATAYSGGVVNIANVIGDIAITAAAVVPAFEYVVPDLDGGTRQNWDYHSSTGFTLNSANGILAVGVSTANSHSYADRESGTFYLIPVPEKACSVTVETTDTKFIEARCYILSDKGGALACVSESAYTALSSGAVTFPFTKGAGNYAAINLVYSHDGSVKTAWGYNTKANITVTFTN